MTSCYVIVNLIIIYYNGIFPHVFCALIFSFFLLSPDQCHQNQAHVCHTKGRGYLNPLILPNYHLYLTTYHLPTWIVILRSLLLKIKICQQAMQNGTVEPQQQSQEQEAKRVRHRGQNRVSLHVSPLIREGVVGSYSIFMSKLLLFGFIYFSRKVNPQLP